MKHHSWLLAGLLLVLAGCTTAQTRGQVGDETEVADDDIKNVKTIGDVTDVGEVSVTPVQASGVGLVYGLDATGGGVPKNEFRQKLEDQLHKQGVMNVKEMLDSNKYTMVFVTAMIPPGVHRGDRVDVEVTLPEQSRATSLRGGKLYECPLRNYDTVQNLKQNAKYNGLLEGWIIAKAQGPLLVGFAEGNEEMRLRRGRIWQGAVSMIDMPLFLYLKEDQRYARVANEVAQRINTAFPDNPEKQKRLEKQRDLLVLNEVSNQINGTFRTPVPGRGETAKPIDKNMVHVNVPFEYRLNAERYLLVLRLIPLVEAPETAAKYRQRLHQMVLDPRETVRAALRLEALGRESIPALKKGLASTNPLVRFATAESLTYLGCTAGIEELARLADQHEMLRGRCLTALASMDEALSKNKLTEMLSSPKPELRFGAFRSLLAFPEPPPVVVGQNVRNTYWLHRVAPTSASLVHLSTSRRAEIVLFGQTPKLVPPFRLLAGSEFTLVAEPGDMRCTVSRYVTTSNPPRTSCKQCSFELDDVLQVMAELGGEYPDAVDLLRQLDGQTCLTCPVAVDALPEAVPITTLAAAGGNADKYKGLPELQRDVLAIQQDLGIIGKP
jgi:Flagellar P-ring protein